LETTNGVKTDSQERRREMLEIFSEFSKVDFELSILARSGF
jgi:hypothetical protein